MTARSGPRVGMGRSLPESEKAADAQGGRFQPPGWDRPDDVAVNDVCASEEGRLALG